MGGTVKVAFASTLLDGLVPEIELIADPETRATLDLVTPDGKDH